MVPSEYEAHAGRVSAVIVALSLVVGVYEYPEPTWPVVPGVLVNVDAQVGAEIVIMFDLVTVLLPALLVAVSDTLYVPALA